MYFNVGIFMQGVMKQQQYNYHVCVQSAFEPNAQCIYYKTTKQQKNGNKFIETFPRVNYEICAKQMYQIVMPFINHFDIF